MSNELRVILKQERLEITCRFTRDQSPVALCLKSDRSKQITKESDVSDRAPDQQKHQGRRIMAGSNCELWFPVVDVGLLPGMYAHMKYTGTSEGTWSMNGFGLHGDVRPSSPELTVPAEELENWENALFTRDMNGAITDFSLRYPLPEADGSFTVDLEWLGTSWSGEISLLGKDGQELARTRVSVSKPRLLETRSKVEPLGLTASQVKKSLAKAVEYIMRSRNVNPRSKTHGGFYLFYDYDAQTFRTSHWIWGWGPAINGLLQAARIPLSTSCTPEEMVRAAITAGDATLRMQVDEPGHPADGIVLVRYEPTTEYQNGHYGYVSMADSGFLCGWAWIPLYEYTRDERFLKAGIALADAADRLMSQYSLIRQDFIPEKKQWTTHTLDESGFGMEGLAELYRVTNDSRFKDIGAKYIEQHLAKFEREDGLWNRTYHHDTDTATPTEYDTRGLAWAMEGLLAAHRILPSGGYLSRACKMAAHLMKWQNPEGFWSFNFDLDPATAGIAEKGTAVWSLLFYRLYSLTGDPEHLNAARRALAWCMNNQYQGPDPDGVGGIVACGPHSGVAYRPWFHLSCLYAIGFFALALMEELKLSER
jgi:hypothetical protein